MPVTELAIMKLRPGLDKLEFLEALMEAQEIQDGWVRDNHPHNQAEHKFNVSSMYLEDTEPPSLLITAPWDSPEAHGEWIQSQANQTAFGKLGLFIAPGCDSVLMFHMDAAGVKPSMSKPFVEKDGKDGFDICRISVDKEHKASLQSQYKELEEEVAKAGKLDSIWAGWRIETAEDKEDLVIFWSSDIPHERIEKLARTPDQIQRRHFTHAV